MKILGTVALAAMLGGCTSVRMVQREGCWIKQTEKKPFKRVREEIGPCVRAQPKWVEKDQLTRLVQECVAQADWRWQVRALDAWSRSRPYPSQPAQEETLKTCMQEARVGLVSENDDLKRRLSDLVADRDTLRTAAEKERTAAEKERERFQEILDRNLGRIQDSHDRIAGYLGEAAQKPAGTATATASATSDGKATNESGATLSSGSNSDSGATAPAAVTASAPVTAPPAPPVQAVSAMPPAPPAQAVSATPAPGEKPSTAARAARAAKPAALRRGPVRDCEVPGAQPAQPEPRAAQATGEPTP